MRIRIFQAFASNNSGSYTIVGSFDTVEAASELAELLRVVSSAHDAWFKKHSYDEATESPLDRFAREHGLSETKPGRGDEWPQYGSAPEVTAIGSEVLIHVPYTVTMPRLFGELFYKHGGRVAVELNHTHEDLAVEIGFFISWKDGDEATRKSRMDALGVELETALQRWVVRAADDDRPAIAPVFCHGHMGGAELTAVFNNVVAGVEAVRQVAVKHQIGVYAVRVNECAHGVVDPLAHLRPAMRPWGTSRVILWSLGDDRMRALKAVREVLGAELRELEDAIENLPKEILVKVERAYAERAVAILRAAGCDAESVIPMRSGSR